MTTPTEPFAHLSLSPNSPLFHMASPEEVRRRAIVLQDILSSFSDKDLPSEVQPGILRNINQNMATPSALHTDWTIQGNLQGSLLQWGAYNDEVWGALSKLQSSNTCAIIFHEKLKTRFHTRLGRYDDIVANPPNAETLKEDVRKVVNDLKTLSDILNRDRFRRQHDEINPNVEVLTLKIALETLEAVCLRTQVIIPSPSGSARRTRGNTASINDPNLTLYMMLIKNADPDDHPFLLESIEKFSGGALRACHPALERISQILKSLRAPEAYIERFGALQRKARNVSQPSTTRRSSSGSSGHQRGHKADPKPGSKRSQTDVKTALTPSKRRKRTGSK